MDDYNYATFPLDLEMPTFDAWMGGVRAGDLERAVEHEWAAGRQHCASPSQQGFSSVPWRDMHHVAAEHRVGCGDWPWPLRHVQSYR